MTGQIKESNQRIGDRYEIRSMLGQGGMADVYLAWDTHLMREIALKILRLDSEFDTKHNEKQKVRLLREARAAARLSHPGIVVIHDLGEYDGRPFISMEYIQGRNLRELHADRMEQGRCLPVRDILSIARQVAAALDYAHSRKVIHRDIKPENIMVTPDGVCKITDFGIARSHVAGLRTLTPHGKLACTWHYAAPEYFQGEQANIRGDQFSFGCVLYELFTGRMAFSGEEAHQVWYRITMVQPVPPSDIAWDLPESVNPVLLKMLAKSPESRFESCGAAVKALENAMADVPPETCFHFPSGEHTTAVSPSTGTLDSGSGFTGRPESAAPDDFLDDIEHLPTTLRNRDAGHDGADAPKYTVFQNLPGQHMAKRPESAHRGASTRQMTLHGRGMRRRVRVLLLILVLVAGTGAFLLVSERMFDEHGLSRSDPEQSYEFAFNVPPVDTGIPAATGTGLRSEHVSDGIADAEEPLENHIVSIPEDSHGDIAEPIDTLEPAYLTAPEHRGDSTAVAGSGYETPVDSGQGEASGTIKTPSPAPTRSVSITPSPPASRLRIAPTVTPETTLTPTPGSATATPEVFEATMTPLPAGTMKTDIAEPTATPVDDRPSRRGPWVPF